MVRPDGATRVYATTRSEVRAENSADCLLWNPKLWFGLDVALRNRDTGETVWWSEDGAQWRYFS